MPKNQNLKFQPDVSKSAVLGLPGQTVQSRRLGLPSQESGVVRLDLHGKKVIHPKSVL